MSTRMRRWALIAMVVGILAAPDGRPVGADDDDAGAGDWPMFTHDPLGTRYNADERQLGPDNVATLSVLWTFPTPGAIASTPAVVNDTVYVGDGTGAFYALDAATGRPRWTTQVDQRITASPIVLRGRIVIGDQLSGAIYGLDKRTGKVLWRILPNNSGAPAIFGSGTQVGDHVAIGITTSQEFTRTTPVFTARGSVVLLDPDDGRVIWQTYTVTDADYAQGATGATIWSTPTYDEDSNTIYVSTGNNYTQPTTDTEDAILALDADRGRIKWKAQFETNDAWSVKFPQGGPDYDFGDSPQIYRLPNGRKVVGAGQKSGFYHVVDAATGAVIPNQQQQYVPGGTQGGLFNDSAVAHGVAFVNGNATSLGPNGFSGLFAVATHRFTGVQYQLWKFEPNSLYTFSGVAVANGVVYFVSVFDPNLYALEAHSGRVLAALPIAGQYYGGPSISHGRVFVGTANSGTVSPAYTRGGSIIALGRP